MKTYLAVLAGLGLFAAAPAFAAGDFFTGVHTNVVYDVGGHAIVPTYQPAPLPGVPNTGGPTAATGPIYTGVHTNVTYDVGGHAIIPSSF